jgi:prepilin-type processing-associated H-X9-DG protein
MFSGAIAPTINSDSQFQAAFHMRPDACIKHLAPSPVNDPTVKIHGTGSHILFADGHLKGYSEKTYFRTLSGITKKTTNNNWDSTESAFFNATAATTNPVAPFSVQRAIQITP